MIDMLDGYLHAIAIGPTRLTPNQWLPNIWGTDSELPPMKSVQDIDRVLDLVQRHSHAISQGFQQQPPEMTPIWGSQTYQGKPCESGDGWAYGFVEGIFLCHDDWLPLLNTPEGQQWLRPIGLLGAEDFSPDQATLTKTPGLRAKLARQIPMNVLSMHAYWLADRLNTSTQTSPKPHETKVGRNENCPCGSGKKFKKCCAEVSSVAVEKSD